jgi:hypothetical protein
MKIAFALVPAAAAVLALAVAPAIAQSGKHPHRQGLYQAQPYAYGEGQSNTRFPDPSFGNRAGIDNARVNGRCVIDLGYGRYEFCD